MGRAFMPWVWLEEVGRGCQIFSREKMQRGEFMFRTKGCVAPIKWQDKKPVKVLPMQHNPIEVTWVKWKNREGTSIFSCLTAIAEYNAIMGGVNCFDQRQE
jgi:hypothetical protein